MISPDLSPRKAYPRSLNPDHRHTTAFHWARLRYRRHLFRLRASARGAIVVGIKALQVSSRALPGSGHHPACPTSQESSRVSLASAYRYLVRLCASLHLSLEGCARSGGEDFASCRHTQHAWREDIYWCAAWLGLANQLGVLGASKQLFNVLILAKYAADDCPTVSNAGFGH